MTLRTAFTISGIMIASLFTGSFAMAQSQGLVLPARGQVMIPRGSSAPVRAATTVKPAEAGDLLLQSHVVFAESWRLLQLQNGTTPNSIFKVISQHLVKDATAAACPKSGMSWQVEQKSTSMSIALKPCGKVKNLTATAGTPAATLSWQAPLRSFELTANTEQFRDVVGDSLAMLNSQLQCKGHWGNDFLLVDLNCKNLGLGLQRSTHVMYQTFNYNSVAQNTDATMLLVEADQYMNLVSRQLCDSSEPCLKLRVPGRGKVAWRKDLRHVVLATNNLPINSPTSRTTPNLAPVVNPVPTRKAQVAADPNINPNSDFYDKSYAQDLPQTEKASQTSQQAAQKLAQNATQNTPDQGHVIPSPEGASMVENQVANTGEQNVQSVDNANPVANMQNGQTHDQTGNQSNVQANNENGGVTPTEKQGDNQNGSQNGTDPQQVASLEQGQDLQITDVGVQAPAGGGQQAEVPNGEEPNAHPVTGPDAVPQGGVHLR